MIGRGGLNSGNAALEKRGLIVEVVVGADSHRHAVVCCIALNPSYVCSLLIVDGAVQKFDPKECHIRRKDGFRKRHQHTRLCREVSWSEGMVACRQASKLAAGALQLHGEAAPAVRKDALDLQKMICAAGGDATVLEAVQCPPTAGAGSAEHRNSDLPPVLLWACCQDALQPGLLTSASMLLHA